MKFFLTIIREFLSDPLAKQVLLWWLTRLLPSSAAMAKRTQARLTPYTLRRMSIDEGLTAVYRQGLRMPACAVYLSKEEMDAEWNGMGPDGWPEWLRQLIDQYAWFIVLCSLPHDLAFAYGNTGDYTGWLKTQEDWEYNSSLCLKTAAATSNWYQRIRQRYIAALISRTLRETSYAFWLAAYRRRTKSS